VADYTTCRSVVGDIGFWLEKRKGRPDESERPFPRLGSGSRSEPHHGVTKAMEGLTTVYEGVGISALERLGVGIEERPQGSCLECFMAWLTPFLEHFRQLGGRDHPVVDGADEEVMGFAIVERTGLVGLNPFVQSAKLLPELTDRSRHQLTQIPRREFRVLPGKTDLS